MTLLTRARRLPLVLLLVALCAVALGMWIRWPSVHMGFHGDDVVHSAMLRGDFPVQRSIFDLFRFADQERDGRALVDFGYLPWWSQENLRIAMFRPLSSALIALDYRLFGENAEIHHLHSQLWWVAMIVAAALALARALPVPAAAAALLLFAVDESHLAPVAWLANRSTLVSCTFALLGLWVHQRYRQAPSLRTALVEGALFTLCLFGGEYGLSALAYVFAFELVGVDAPEDERARSTYPVLAAVAICFVLRWAFDFGIRGSGYYISPLYDIRAFADVAVSRFPALAGDLLATVPAAWWVVGSPAGEPLPDWRRTQAWIGVASLAAFALLTFVVGRRVSAPTRRSLHWLALGSVLSLLPGAGALPEDRLLVAASFGASGVFGTAFAEAARAAVAAVRMRTLKQALMGLVGLALLGLIVRFHFYQPILHNRQGAEGFPFSVALQRRWSLEAEIPRDASKLRIVFLSAADFTTNAMLPWVRKLYGLSLPRSYWRLSGTNHVQEIRRIAPNAFELLVLASDLDETMAGSLYRSKKRPMVMGRSFRVDGMRVQVLGTIGGNPWRTRFTFDQSVDDGQYLFLHSTPTGMRRISMPPVGGKLRLPMPSPPQPL